MEQPNNQIGRATAWSSVTEILAKLISPLVNMILARLLAPEAFGVVATIMMVISFAEIFTDAGFQKYIVQHEFADQDALDRSTNVAFWTNLAVSGVICGLIFLLRHSIAALVGSPGLGETISIASGMILLAAFSSIQMARYKRDFDFKSLFFVRMGAALIPLLVTVPLAAVLRNHWALLIGSYASQLFNAVVLTLKSRWKPRLFYSFSLLKEMLSFSAWTLAESISIWLTGYIGVFIVGNSLSDYYLGLYKTTMTTINSYLAIITSSAMPVLFSALSRYQNDPPRYRETFYRFQRYTALLVLPMGVGILLFHQLVTGILLGSQWMEASPFIGLWGFTGALMIVFSNFSSEICRSKGQPRLSMAVQLVHLLFVVPALLLTLDRGFTALYTARSLIRIHLALTSMLAVQIKFDFRITDTVKNIAPAIFSAAAMGVFGWVLKPLRPGTAWQFAVIGLCVVFYFAVLLLLFPSVRKELQSSKLMRKLRKK